MIEKRKHFALKLESSDHKHYCRALLLIVSFLFCSLPVFSQEDCFNGIDDDGDGLIDLNDPDGCDCMSTGTGQEFIVNGNFEDYDCCPSDASQFDCAEGWYTPNLGTTDYFNTCNWNGGGTRVHPIPPPPYPSGNGSAGFFIREDPTEAYREYVAQCLASPLIGGNTYTLMFDLSGAAQGLWEDVFGNPNEESDFLELGLYGTTSCPSSWGTIECPPSSSYDLILSEDLTVSTDGTWDAVTLTFTPASNYTGIALGGRCNVTIQNEHYWWIDNISIYSGGSIDDPTFTVDGNSCLGLSLTADQDTFDVYQWFINGVAVQGANGLNFDLPPDSLPEVVLGVKNNGNCAFSFPFDTIPEPPILLEFTYDSIDCFGETTTVDLFVEPSGNYNYQWSNGGSSPSNQLGAGTHSVTVTNEDNGCTIDTSFTLVEPPPLDGQITLDVPVGSGSGTGVASVEGFGGTPPYTYLWSDGTTGPIHDMVIPGLYSVTITDANGCQTVVDIIIPAPALVINVVSTDPICAGSCNGTAMAEVNGGLQPYSYSWSNGDTTLIADSLCAGSYTVEVTDAEGNIIDASVDISEPDSLTLEGSVQDIQCNQAGSISIALPNGEDSLSFQWSNGDSTAQIQIHDPGLYALTVTDQKGCKSIDSFQVNSAALQYSLDIDSITCLDPFGKIEVVVDTGLPSYFITWTDGDSSFLRDSLIAGSYAFTLTGDSSCVVNDTILLQEAPELTINSNISEIKCEGDTGVISIVVEGGRQPYAYRWSNGDSAANIQINEAGTYGLTITDGMGCEVVDTFQVGGAALQYSLKVDSVTCLNPFGTIEVAVETGRPPYTITWADGDSTFLRDSLSAGSYAFTLTDDSSCMYRDTVIFEDTAQLTINTDVGQISCYDGLGQISVQVDGGQPPYTYIWSNGANSAVVQNLQAGIHTVTATDANGCQVIERYTLEQPPELRSSFSTSNASCAQSTDGSISVSSSGGTPPYEYRLNGMADSLTGLGPGSYEVVTVDSNGCTRMDTITVEFDTVDISYVLTKELPNCGMDNGSLRIETDTSLYDIQWSTGSNQPLIQDLSAGSYAFTLTNAEGCTRSDSIELSALSTIDVAASITHESCSGAKDGSIEIKAIPPDSVTYQWSHGSTKANVGMLAPGGYSLTVTDRNGCDTLLRFEIEEGNRIELSADIDTALCFGDTSLIILSAEPGSENIQYIWNNGYMGDQRQLFTSGQFEIIANDPQGCSDTINVGLDYPESLEIEQIQLVQPDASQSMEGLIEVEVTGGSPPYILTWSTGASGNLIDGLGPGEYTVIATDRKGCSSERTFILTEAIADIDLYIPNSFSPNRDEINDHWTVFTRSDRAVITAMEIYNRWGGLLYEIHDIPTNQPSLGWDGYFKGQLLDPAVFVYRVIVRFHNGEEIIKAGDVMLIR